MRKLFTIILLAIACCMMAANDIIVTLSGEKIEAKITNVTRDAVTYKMPDYLDGADFTISTSELSSIIFGNGQVKVYTAPAKADEKPAAKDAGAAAEVLKPIIKENGEFMHDGRYITEREVWRVIEKDPACAKLGKRYGGVLVTGAVIMGAGIPVLIAAIPTALKGDIDTSVALYASGVSMAAAGGIVALCAIPVRTKAIETYNSKAGYAGEIRLQYSADGIGLAYSF